MRVALCGIKPTRPLAQRLEAAGLTVVARPSAALDLLAFGDPPGFAALEAADAGVPVLWLPDVEAVLAGAPLADFIAPRGPAVADAAAFIAARLAALRPEIEAVETGDPWEDVLTVTLTPTRTLTRLHHLGGTPTYDRIMALIQRQSWPRVAGEVSASTPLSLR
ncbi:MAG: hypothetical protein R3F60_16035 [bacterium]